MQDQGRQRKPMASQQEQSKIGDKELREICSNLLSTLHIFERKAFEVGITLSISDVIRPEADFVTSIAIPSSDGKTIEQFKLGLVSKNLKPDIILLCDTLEEQISQQFERQDEAHKRVTRRYHV